jgi:hypothetical protein
MQRARIHCKEHARVGEEAMPQQQRLNEYHAMTPVLMDYGWFVPPFINGKEHERIKKLVDNIQANPPADDAAKRAIEEKIHKEFLDVAFSVQARARYVWLGLRTPHIYDYSHLYESAVFAYYKREYAAGVCLLLVALEGVLLSINGWRVGQPSKPSFAQLKATIANLPLAELNPSMNATQAAFRDALSDFIGRWIYANTSNADFTLSVLNRHYVLHGMDAGNFYRPHDFHRLLLGFDLLIDLVAIINSTYHESVEADVDKYEERLKFYDQLRGGTLQIGAASDREQELLKQHPNYVPPAMEAHVELHINR